MLYRYLVLLPLMALLSMTSSIAAENLVCNSEVAKKAGWKEGSNGYCYASQGWDKWEYTEKKYWNTDEEQHPSHYFWHVAQGTMIMPYDLFMALPNPTGKGKFSDTENLAKFGFIPSIKTDRNPEQLPIGFVKDLDFKDPYTDAKMKMLGFNCAACHTGELHYKGEKFLIEGGQAMVDMTTFKDALGLAIVNLVLPSDIQTQILIKKLVVLIKDKQVGINKEELAKTLKSLVVHVATKNNLMEIHLHKLLEYKEGGEFPLLKKLPKTITLPVLQEAIKKILVSKNNSIEGTLAELDFFIKKTLLAANFITQTFPTEGIGRVDALTRIGNLVFGEDLRVTENVRPVTAPVSYPPLWTVPWFDWAQYNGSIRQPMVRNVGEALGVNALLNLTDKAKLFDSSVNIPNLVKIEELLQGTEKLQGLTAPQYPGGIDTQKAQHGKMLYTELCQSCHLPPVNSKEILTDKYWELPNEYGKQYLITHNIPLKTIGTDPTVALEFYKRTANAEKLKLGTLAANDGLKIVTQAVAEKWYKDNNIPEKMQDKMNGYRKNIVLKPLAYRARPLNGVWSTPPYLHNGSILNIYELLSPYEERTKVFYSGTKEFDPINLGYKNLPVDTVVNEIQDGEKSSPSQENHKTSKILRMGTKIDTTQPGNFNTGHEFNDVARQGVIGRKLSEEERYALVEYIKTLH